MTAIFELITAMMSHDDNACHYTTHIVLCMKL